MHFEELDAVTRRFMLDEFNREQESATPYTSRLLTNTGKRELVEQMRRAIRSGDPQDLVVSLARAPYWDHTDRRGYTVNVRQSAERLARTEFNTWYVRGLSRKLLSEGVNACQVVRAEECGRHASCCSGQEGRILRVEDVYRGHRARYWPEPGDPDAICLPFHPSCHHTIRRISH